MLLMNPSNLHVSRKYRNQIFRSVILSTLLVFQGCAGYTTKITLPNDIQTIYVPTVRNIVPIENMLINVPGMEADMTNACVGLFSGP